MTGSSVFDYIHVGDHAELAEQLGLQTPHAACGNIHPDSHSDEGSNSRAHSPTLPDRGNRQKLGKIDHAYCNYLNISLCVFLVLIALWAF